MGLSDKVLDRAFTPGVLGHRGGRVAGLGREHASRKTERDRVRTLLKELMAALRPARLHFGWRVIAECVAFLERRASGFRRAPVRAGARPDHLRQGAAETARRRLAAIPDGARRLPEGAGWRGAPERIGAEGRGTHRGSRRDRKLPLLAVAPWPRIPDAVTPGAAGRRVGDPRSRRTERSRSPSCARRSSGFPEGREAPEGCRLLVDDEPLDARGSGVWVWKPGYYAGPVRAELLGPDGGGARALAARREPGPQAKVGPEFFTGMVRDILEHDPELVLGTEPARHRLGALGETEDPLVELGAPAPPRRRAPPRHRRHPPRAARACCARGENGCRSTGCAAPTFARCAPRCVNPPRLPRFPGHARRRPRRHPRARRSSTLPPPSAASTPPRTAPRSTCCELSGGAPDGCWTGCGWKQRRRAEAATRTGFRDASTPLGRGSDRDVPALRTRGAEVALPGRPAGPRSPRPD